MFIHVATQQYPLTYEDIKKANQHISFTTTMNLEFLESIGYTPVTKDPQPMGLSANQFVTLSPPVLEGDGWVQHYQVHTYTFNNLVDTNNQPIDPTIAEQEFVTQTKRQLKKQIADFRYLQEIRGIEVNGIQISTTRGSQASIAGTYNLAIIDPLVEINWKSVDGWFVLNATLITSIMSAVSLHVQDCFTKERLLVEKLETLTPSQIYSFSVETEWNLLT